MAEKTLKTRIIQKHDTEANWLLATNFTPLNGEIIIYDEDDNYNYKRIKVGNGINNVNDLDFIKNENNEDCLRFIEQDLDNSEIVQVLSNLNLISFCELRNSSIIVKKDDFNENGVCYFNERNISIMPEDFGFYEYRLSFNFSSYEEIGLPMEVEGNQHPSTAPIQFKDFILVRDQIYIAREDVEIPDKMYIMPGKLILNYNTNSIYSVGFNKSELEDGTKVAYFSETFEKISEKWALGQNIIFTDYDNNYSLLAITSGYIKLQGISDEGKLITITWNEDEEYGYITEQNLGSGAEKFLITIIDGLYNEDENKYIFAIDKTYDEIVEAYDNNKILELCDNNWRIPLALHVEDGFVFKKDTLDAYPNIAENFTFIIMPDEVTGRLSGINTYYSIYEEEHLDLITENKTLIGAINEINQKTQNLEVATDADMALEVLAETGTAVPVTNENNVLYTNDDGKLYIL